MDFYKVLENRVSNKDYNPEPVPKEILDKMISSALMAPSWKNKTCYSFIFIDDLSKKKDIANTILNTSDDASNAIKQAPLVAIIVANPLESGHFHDKDYYLVDCGIAMEHLVLAATNEGYGTCWIGSFEEEPLKKILNVPNHFKIVAMTPIGKSKSQTEKFPPKDISSHIYYNNWSTT